MRSKIMQSIIAGLVATAIMTGFIFLAPRMGLPKMNPAEMFASMMGVPIMVGYLMHCMIGIIFAAAYVYLFNSKVHTNSTFLKGALFGFAVFIFAQIMMFVIGKIMPMPMMEGSIALMMTGSLIGHLVFGIAIALIVPNYAVEQTNNIRAAHT